MSHRATNWAIARRGLTPAAKLLLWHLADRHNGDTGRCDPSQERLASDCEMSRATINRHLDKLERAGLIRRLKRLDAKNNRQLSTSYELALDGAFSVSQIETRKPSEKEADPCLNLKDSRVSICDTNPVREPGREVCAASVTDQTATDGLAANEAMVENTTEQFDRFWDKHPRPRNRDATAKAWRDALTEGATEGQLEKAAASYAVEQAGNPVKYIKGSDLWLSQGRWRDHIATALPPAPRRAAPIDQARFWSEKIKAGAYIAPSAIGCAVARLMVERGMVSAETLRAKGLTT